MTETSQDPEALLRSFEPEDIINQDQAGRRIVLHGRVRGQPGLLSLERAPFPSTAGHFSALPARLARLESLGANDIYFWYLAHAPPAPASPPDLKLNLIWPCTPAHVAKYRAQGVRSVTETARFYREHVRAYVARTRAGGALDWVWNILDGTTEAGDVIFRTPRAAAAAAAAPRNAHGFLLLPDLHWDRATVSALHLLGLVERRDLWSLRDLKKKHVPWLRDMRRRFVEATVAVYGVRADALKLYVHYQPTYYHFHVHVVHVALEAGATQATGKALGLDEIISLLQVMGGDAEAGMDSDGVDLTFTLGEESALWKEVFAPAREGEA